MQLDPSDDQGIEYPQNRRNQAHEQDATGLTLNYEMTELDSILRDEVSPILIQFYNTQLKIQCNFKFDALQNNSQIFKGKKFFYSPIPNLYFLPHTILLQNEQKLAEIKENLRNHYPNLDYLRPNSQNDELQLKIHGENQAVFYKIRNIGIKLQYQHKLPYCYDRDMLVNKLYQFYSIILKDLYFEEVGGLFLYWAYRKNILGEDYITQSAYKLITIALFINYGAGIPNILLTYRNKNRQRFDKMLKMSFVNKKGQCQLDSDLFQETNFSIRQKKGFYIASKQRYMKIKEILPIQFPLKIQQIKLSPDEKKKIDRIKDKTSICKSLFRLFKTLSDDLNRSCKITIDFRQKTVFKSEDSQFFSLQVIDPVFHENLTQKLSSSATSLRIVRSEVEKAYNATKVGENSPFAALMKIFATK